MALPKEFADEIASATDQVAAEAEAADADDATTAGDTVATDDTTVVSAKEGGDMKAGNEASEAGTAAGDEAGDTASDADGEGGNGGSSKGAEGVSDAALTQAVLAGIPLESARTFVSDDAIMRAVKAINDRVASVSRDSASPAGAEEEEATDPFADLALDPEKFEPETIEAFGALTSIVKQQHEELQSFKDQQRHAEQAGQDVSAREVEGWFDERINGLGDDFSDILGAGGHSSLVPGSPQVVKRDGIANQMAVMLAGYQATGQQAPPRNEVFDVAARLVLRDEYQKVFERKLSEDLAGQEGQHISRAAGGETKSKQDPIGETAALLDEKFFRKGKG